MPVPPLPPYPRVDPSFFSKADLGIAYRKMKADLFYERGHSNAFRLCEFEEDLTANLDRIYERLTTEGLEWLMGPDVLGTWRIITKDLKPAEKKDESGPRDEEEEIPWIPSDPKVAWETLVAKGKPTATFRVVSDHPIDFHLVSTVWALKVGHKFDGILGDHAYGTRIRRLEPNEGAEKPGEPSRLSTGTFKPYLGQFKSWRSDGINAMKKALDEGKKVIAITADVKQFYHRIGPGFLLNPKYLKAVGLDGQLSEDEKGFTRAIIEAIKAWNAIVKKELPSYVLEPSVGLPVGLPSARLIANVALAELDKKIREELRPIHYGRYVDDLILVVEDTKGYTNSKEAWDDILHVLKGRERQGILDWDEDRKGLRVTRDYLERGELVFVGKKQKVFRLEGDTGKALLHSIERTVQSTSSEWRSLPELPSGENGLAARLVTACDSSGENADNLRKTDTVSAKRQALALQLRDLEALERDLLPGAWKTQRIAFFRAATDHLLAPKDLMETATYAPRLLGLAIACQDFEEAKKLVTRLLESVEMISESSEVKLAGTDSDLTDDEQMLVLRRWMRSLAQTLDEVLCASLGVAEVKSDLYALDELRMHLTLPHANSAHIPHRLAGTMSALEWGGRLHDHDLARHPYRLTAFGEEIRLPDRRARGEDAPSIEVGVVETDSEYVHDAVKEAIKVFSGGAFKDYLPLPFVFPTRPFSVSELFLLRPALFEQGDDVMVKAMTLGFRGFGIKHPPPRGSRNDDVPEKNVVTVPFGEPRDTQRIAVTSFLTQTRSWNASVTGFPDPDGERHSRLMKLVNEILGLRRKPSYVVFPELSMKPWWFLRIAGKLAHAKISTIAGIEYQKHPTNKNGLANQVWCSLVTDAFDFPASVVYRQDKQIPAVHEKAEMQNMGGKVLEPLLPRPWKPVIVHGDFRFGALICNELTNIEYRQPLRGRVDAVVVVEWNQDTETFASLVEASALDVHAYIIQCNNRQFGDSRIRCPAKEPYHRDEVRIKGGLEDYFVIGSIDVGALRAYQTTNISPGQPFKPVPTGFKIDPKRTRLPGGGD
jgi:predicted amidohydrolase